MPLTLIYHFRPSESLEASFVPASYRVVYFFSDQGFLEQSLLQEMSKSVPDADHDLLSFLSLDDLRAFGSRVCQEVGSGEVRLISIQDYNIGVDGARDLKGFQAVFTKFGETVVNEEASKKKGFLGKLFS
ncbi:MAG TPA: hypothetical protein VNJ01_16295 [Bacteriovoracaceae bacterium]|nr:hypothetical protein [Bacteriovoracaceae bacterium]